MTRKAQTYEWWKTEVQYIQSIDPLNPTEFRIPGSFAISAARDSFASYCDMQARFVREDGFPLFAKDITDLSDIAKFRNR